MQLRSRWNELILIGLVFATALGFRILYILQISHAPFFDAPYGDSELYVQAARTILSGRLLPYKISFHSSPPYPYFIALIFAVSGQSFFVLYCVQALIGSLNCVLIYFLAKRLSGGSLLAATLGGLFAAAYGLLAFFDGDVLMITLTVFFTDLALLLLLQQRATGRTIWAVLAGAAWGFAALDKVNLLTFAPVASLFLASGLRGRPRIGAWRPAVGFLIALGVTIFPVTLCNWMVKRDFVLVSSNGGVNFFIGNNPDSQGIFSAFPQYGLTDPGLEGSATFTAERTLGKRLKPSEMSWYWTMRGIDFYRQQPLAALHLLAKKLLLLFNYFEIPNHMSFDFVRVAFAPVLNWMPIGFWLVAPLAVAGIAWRVGGGPREADRLCLAFLVCYSATLILFFITERYRLPVVPVLVAYAAVSLSDFLRCVWSRPFAAIGFWGIAVALSGLVVWLPPPVPYQFTLDLTALGVRYSDRAMADAAGRDEYLRRAVVYFKSALERAPGTWFIHHDLAVAYERMGFYSGATSEFARALELNPSAAETRKRLSAAMMEARRGADRVVASELPLTPFEAARALRDNDGNDAAFAALERLVADNPDHAAAYHEMGLIRSAQGDDRAAVKLLEKASQLDPTSSSVRTDLDATRQRLR